MNKERMDEMAAAARRIIDASAPAVLTTTQVAEAVAAKTGSSTQTVKKYLRAAAEDGQLLEVQPNSGFWVTLPPARSIKFRVVVEQRYPLRLAFVDGERTTYSVPSHYGPGKTTYMTTPEQAKILGDAARTVQEEEKAKEQEKRDADKKAERAEIKRRDPELLKLLRRLEFALTPNWDDRRNQANASAHLFEGSLRRGDHPYEERNLSVHLHASGAGASALAEILATGLEQYIDKLDWKYCAHCDMLILPTVTKDGVLWWHQFSTNVKCADMDTKAEPVETGP